MGLRFLLSALVGLFTLSAFAQSSPVDALIETGGYEAYPVLQCPATNEAIKDFRKKLLDLKKAIKTEANCKGIEADVAGLTDLITKQRDGILSLITKGQSQGLTEAEQGKVESYVQQVTEKTSNLISVLTGKDACFDEDKKGMSLEFITTLIGEGSKILAIVGGPEVGATIQVAGEVITGFLKAMKAIQNSRQGYKFKDTEQRMAYAESLCSLFDYRRELTKLIDPYDSVGRLVDLSTSLEKQINLLQQNCPECREIITMVEEMSIKARDSKPDSKITMDDVWPKAFEASVSLKAQEVDKLYVNRLGTRTYRSLKTLSWIPLRVRTLESNNLKADLGLEDVVSEMASIEKFMVTEQAPYFVKQLVAEAQEWDQKIVNHMTSAMYTVQMLRYNYPDLKGPTPKHAFGWGSQEEAFGYLLEVLDTARDQVSSGDRALIRTYFKDLESLARSLTIAADVANNYCSFFELADWYRSGIHQQCGGKRLQEMRAAASRYTNYRMMMPSNTYDGEDGILMEPMPVVVAEQVEGVVTQDWVESLTRTVDDMTEYEDYNRRTPEKQVTPGPVVIDPKDEPLFFD